MQIGELYVGLGIKGSDKTLDDLLATQDGLKGAAASARDVQAVFANLGIKNSQHTVAGLLQLQDGLENTHLAALKAAGSLEDIADVEPDDHVTMLADMRDSLSEIAQQGRKAGEALGEVKPKEPQKTHDQLSGFMKGLKSIASLSFEAKVAIFAAMYALEQLFSKSAHLGTDLVNYGAAMGPGTNEVLQRYAKVGNLKAGVSEDQMAQTFKHLSEVATDIFSGGTPPVGYEEIASALGVDLQPSLMAAQQGHPEQLMQLLQKYAQTEKNPGWRNRNLNSFVPPDVAAALTRGVFTPDNLASAPIYTEQQTKDLDEVREQIARLENKLGMAVGKFAAKHGGELFGDIEKLIDPTLRLADAFVTLAEKAKVFEAIGDGIKALAALLTLATTEVGKFQDATTGPDGPKKTEARKGLMEDFLKVVSGFLNPAAVSSMITGAAGLDWSGTKAPDVLPKPEKTPAWERNHLKLVTPPPPVGTGGGASTSGKVEIKQTLNFQHDGTDYRKAADAHKKAADGVARQMPAIRQGS